MAKKAHNQPKSASAKGRVRQLDKKQTKQKARKDASKKAPLPGSFKLLGQVFDSLRQNWKILGGIVLVYTILNFIFAGGLLSDLNTSIQNARLSHHLGDALSGYGSLLGTSSGGSQTGSAAQTVLLIVESLVIIWALRHLLSGEKIGVKQAYYQSMAPLVPFLLVVVVIILQLVPMTIGALLLAVMLDSAAAAIFVLFFMLVFLALTVWSVSMVINSFFALYIVTLPDMQPRQALRSAKNLAHYRRWTLLHRLLFLLAFVLVALGVVIVPVIWAVPAAGAAIFFLLLMLTVLFVHTYLYSLYRSLMA